MQGSFQLVMITAANSQLGFGRIIWEWMWECENAWIDDNISHTNCILETVIIIDK